MEIIRKTYFKYKLVPTWLCQGFCENIAYFVIYWTKILIKVVNAGVSSWFSSKERFPALGLYLIYVYLYENTASARRHTFKFRCINFLTIWAEGLLCWWLSIRSGMPSISQWSEIRLFLQETGTELDLLRLKAVLILNCKRNTEAKWQITKHQKVRFQ